jgi:hypothetical protein
MFCCGYYICITLLLWVALCLENSIWYIASQLVVPRLLSSCFYDYIASRFCCELLFASRIVFDILFYFGFCISPHNSLCLGCCRVAFLITFASCFCCELLVASRIVFDIILLQILYFASQLVVPRLLSSCFSDYIWITILLWVAGCLENSIWYIILLQLLYSASPFVLPLLLHIHTDFVVGCYLPREICLAFSTYLKRICILSLRVLRLLSNCFCVPLICIAILFHGLPWTLFYFRFSNVFVLGPPLVLNRLLWHCFTIIFCSR